MSRIMPLDPDSFVHKIALSILTLILLTSFVPLLVLGGRPPILEMLKSGNVQSLGDAVSVRHIDLIYQFLWTIPATLIVAGWPIARTFRAVLLRLGMVRPSMRQVAFGTGAGLVLAAIAGFVIDPAIHWLWASVGWPTTDVGVFEQLLKQLKNPLGAVLIGVTAGVGEEMAVRGLLQPRIGLIASNLVFTAFHAFQYGARRAAQRLHHRPGVGYHSSAH
jgi:membrane protease YdiL (CAAX protease family)